MGCRQPRGDILIRRKSSFPRWLFFIPHVEKKNSPRRRETILRTYRLIPPKFYFLPTWRIFCFYRAIWESLRRDSLVQSKGAGSVSRICTELPRSPYAVAWQRPVLAALSADVGSSRTEAIGAGGLAV